MDTVKVIGGVTGVLIVLVFVGIIMAFSYRGSSSKDSFLAGLVLVVSLVSLAVGIESNLDCSCNLFGVVYSAWTKIYFAHILPIIGAIGTIIIIFAGVFLIAKAGRISSTGLGKILGGPLGKPIFAVILGYVLSLFLVDFYGWFICPMYCDGKWPVF